MIEQELVVCASESSEQATEMNKAWAIAPRAQSPAQLEREGASKVEMKSQYNPIWVKIQRYPTPGYIFKESKAESKETLACL